MKKIEGSKPMMFGVIECWVEVVDGSCITISATSADAWFGEEEEAPAAATGAGR
jgi:hypothetical protein